jgi:hypothetical protein
MLGWRMADADLCLVTDGAYQEQGDGELRFLAAADAGALSSARHTSSSQTSTACQSVTHDVAA